MDLRERLARLDRLTNRPAPPRAQGTTGPVCVPAELELEQVAADGPWSRDVVIGLPPPPLPDLAGLLARSWDAATAPEQLLLLDTETTGLAGGTGTVAFLVGLAWWEGDRLRIRQHFLPGPAHEPALLDAVAKATAGRDVVVSFNGASFDWPLLRTRALLNRREDPLSSLAGWDLLVPARRLWGRVLPDCRQQTLETAVCGMRRGGGDISGDRIPQTWFDFLAGGDAAPLRRVLTHNARDMEGMARLLCAVAAAARGLEEPPAAAAPDWRLAWALGRTCERRRAHGAAAAWMRAAAEAGPAREDRAFLGDAVRILKRDRDWSRALRLIDAALAAGGGEAWLHREAAIIWEHRLDDPDKALAHARRSGDLHRIVRLERRRGRGGRGKGST